MQLYKLYRIRTILGDPGAVSRVDKMFVVKVFCKIETFERAVPAAVVN